MLFKSHKHQQQQFQLREQFVILQEWDPELADVACAHVAHCQYLPDQCHATKSYDLPGQNLFASYFTLSQPTPEDEFKDAIDDWYSRFIYTDVDAIDSFQIK